MGSSVGMAQLIDNLVGCERSNSSEFESKPVVIELFTFLEVLELSVETQADLGWTGEWAGIL
jgi:hypothetical protein